MKSSEFRRWAMTGVALAAIAGPAWAQEKTTAAANSDVEAIVVTATKRTERLIDVPLAVTAISNDDLNRQNITGNEDLARVVPSLSFTQLSPGENSLSLRGLTNGYGLFPTVSYYVDETPFDMRQDAKSGTPSVDMFDASRVEVLRGPQGTLFGSGSLGGTVRVVLNQPNPKLFEGKSEVGLSQVDGGGMGYTAKLMLNGPISDKLAVRMTATSRRYGGFTDIIRPANYYVVSPTDPVVAKNANYAVLSSVRVAFGWTPDDTWYVSPSVYFQRANAKGYNHTDTNRAKYTYARGFQEQNTNDILIGNLTVRKQLGFAEIMSSSAYTSKNSDSPEDYSAWVARRYSGFTGNQRTNVPYFPTNNYQPNLYWQWTQEVRLTSTGDGPLSWIAGAYFSSVKQKEQQLITSPVYAIFYANRFALPYSPVLLDYRATTLDKQYAAFADATYKPIKMIEISAGVRFYKMNARDVIYQQGLQAGAGIPEFGGKQHGINPRFNLKFAPTEDMSFYVSASKGFRPGGPNTSLLGTPGTVCSLQNLYNKVYESDSVWNYEGGAKMQLLDRKITFNAAVYQIDWSNIQGSLSSTCGTFIANFGTARIRGVEAEIYWKALPRLTFNASGSFNQAEFSNLKAGVPGALSIAVGRRLVNTPKEKWAVGAEYSFGGPWGSDGYVRSTVQHVGSTPTSYTLTAQNYYRPNYTNVDAELGAYFGKTEVQIYVENLFDTYQVIGRGNSQTQTYPVDSVAPPRTFGFAVRRPF